MFGLFKNKRTNNHLFVITLDSCRFDSFMAAEPENIAKLCGGLHNVEKRYSYAGWTAPSHYNLLTGLVPHSSPTEVYASEYYKHDLYKFKDRLGVDEAGFEAMIPHLWLPSYMKAMGYENHALVSLPVLNPATGINRDFDTFKLMPKHNDMLAMLDDIENHKTRESKGLTGNTPQFYLMNVGETHYPYGLPDEDKNDLPHISGVNGIFRKLDNQINEDTGDLVSDNESGDWMDMEMIDKCRQRQIDTVKYLDKVVFPRFYDMLPKDTWVIVTADHGELFGEAGYFGHGPIMHEKCFEVPFLEGKLK